MKVPGTRIYGACKISTPNVPIKIIKSKQNFIKVPYQFVGVTKLKKDPTVWLLSEYQNSKSSNHILASIINSKTFKQQDCHLYVVQHGQWREVWSNMNHQLRAVHFDLTKKEAPI